MRFIKLLILLMIPLGLSAQRIHMPGIWVSGSADVLLVPRAAEKVPAQGSLNGNPIGGSGALGVDYTFQGGHFLLNVGAGVSYSMLNVRSADMSVFMPETLDLNGLNMTYEYRFSSRSDRYSRVALLVPLRLGGAFGRFYFLLGGTLDFSFLGKSQPRYQVMTAGHYAQFVDTLFTDMPEHQFFSNMARTDSVLRVSYLPDVRASIELGYRFSEPTKGRSLISLSLYADMGLLGLLRTTTSSKPLYLTPDEFVDASDWSPMMEGLSSTPALHSSAVPAGVLRALSVGVKLTISFPQFSLSHHSKYPCKCLEE